ncbi:MAG: hypothetical protein H0W39_06710 [Sphingomonas sp.]|nr:hypothetical protein [Sphingomonas sp.]
MLTRLALFFVALLALPAAARAQPAPSITVMDVTVALNLWHDNCIDKLLSCSGFVLGNGKQALGAFGGPWNATPRLVPIPPQ